MKMKFIQSKSSPITLKLISLFIFLTIFFFDFHTVHSWRYDQRPRIHWRRVRKSMLYTENKRVQKKIIQYHNYFRANVHPQASNMLEMSYDPTAATKAQNWADQCRLLTHDDATDRQTKYGACGQNIFVSTHKVPWLFAIKTWNLEHQNFTYGSQKNKLGVVGHYTQLVWATSHKVGCGYSTCYSGQGKTWFNYICNYCPIGNWLNSLGTPYNYGEPCSDCPHSCSSNLCTNSCPFSDDWVNCGELKKEWPDWLCRDRSREGMRRRKHCRATCNCQNKIIQKYDFYSHSQYSNQYSNSYDYYSSTYE